MFSPELRFQIVNFLLHVVICHLVFLGQMLHSIPPFISVLVIHTCHIPKTWEGLKIFDNFQCCFHGGQVETGSEVSEHVQTTKYCATLYHVPRFDGEHETWDFGIATVPEHEKNVSEQPWDLSRDTCSSTLSLGVY